MQQYMTSDLQFGFKEGNKYAWDFAEFNFREFYCFSPSSITDVSWGYLRHVYRNIHQTVTEK